MAPRSAPRGSITVRFGGTLAHVATTAEAAAPMSALQGQASTSPLGAQAGTSWGDLALRAVAAANGMLGLLVESLNIGGKARSSLSTALRAPCVGQQLAPRC